MSREVDPVSFSLVLPIWVLIAVLAFFFAVKDIRVTMGERCHVV